jgi:YhcG PDDEXK nuclease domain
VGNAHPTVFILCRDKKRSIVEYALRNINSPIAVSTHRLPQQLADSLPTAEQLQQEMETAVAELESEKEPPVP